MGQIIFLTIALGLSYKIFICQGVHKLTWFFAGILFFPPSIILLQAPVTTFPRFIIYTLIVTTIIQRRHLKDRTKSFPLSFALIFMLLSMLIIGIADSRLQLYLRFYRPFIYFIDNFSVLFLTYIYINDQKDIVYIFKKLFVFAFVLCLYGLLNVVTGKSEYMQFITNIYGGFDAANLNMGADRSRFRISSFTHNPIYYGFVLSTLLLIKIFVLNTYTNIKEFRIYLGVLFLLLLNLFLTNSRTPLIGFLSGFAILSIFSMGLKKKLKLFISGIAVVLTLGSILPDSFRLIDKTLETFSSKGSDLEGSSIAMREAQLAASLLIFSNKPLLGHGFKYIHEDLGFAADVEERQSDNDLKGFESYSYALLIEQGILGMLANLVFFVSIFLWLFRQLKYSDRIGRKYIVLSFAILASFLLFIFGTGALGSFTICLAVLGVILKGVLLYDRRNIESI